MRRKLLALLLLLLPTLAAAQRPPELIVQAPPSLERAAAKVRAVEPGRLLDAMRLVGLKDPGPPIQVLLGPEGSDLAMVPPWVSGYAFGEEGVIVLLPARAPSYPDSSLEELLRHEVAHVLVARAAGGRPLPRWFHEGLAMIAGLSWGLDDRSQLTLTLVGDGEVSLEQLEQEFRGERGAVQGAYAMAGAFANVLLRRHGDDAAARILAEVARGLSFEDAFQSATGTSLAEAERAFWRRQTLLYRWVPLLTSSVTLWLLITLLAIWAMGKRRARDAALRRIWEEEEERRLAAPEILRQDSDEPVN
ncbi:MAG: hypothetical protein QOH06_4960 [Acidobacteriota bacterium]|jgi:hypothetical protein|nr:hypothetical protein [Acidobacteriota bacterium]